MLLEEAVVQTARNLIAAIDYGEQDDKSGMPPLCIAIEECSAAITRLGYRDYPPCHENANGTKESISTDNWQALYKRLARLWPSLGYYLELVSNSDKWLKAQSKGRKANAGLGDALDDIASIVDDFSNASHSHPDQRLSPLLTSPTCITSTPPTTCSHSAYTCTQRSCTFSATTQPPLARRTR